MVTYQEEERIISLRKKNMEFGWRYNNRMYGEGIFERLLGQIANVKIVKAI